MQNYSSFILWGLLFVYFWGFLWKDKLPNGVQAGLKSGEIPIERLLLETDAPFMYPKINDKKLPQTIRDAISEEAKNLHKVWFFILARKEKEVRVRELRPVEMG